MTGSRKKILIAIVIIAAVVVAGLIGFFQLRNMAAQGSTQIPETTVLKKTDLENKVTASGNFASRDPVSIGSNAMGGEVADVFVDTGDKVYAGDVLARLKTSDIERNIEDTRSAISDMAKGDKQKIESAQRAFDEADENYKAVDNQTNDAVSKTQKAYDNANNTWNTEKANLEKALSDAQKELDDAIAANAPLAEIEAKTKARDAAKAALEAVKAARNQAKDALDAAKQQRENSLRSANSAWYNAKANLDSLSGVDSTKQSRTQLASLNEELSNASIISPITGIVTMVNTEAGKSVLGDMFMIEDTETLQIKANVAEYDIIKIEKGMNAHVKSNATGDEAYEGVVDYVAPKALDTNGNFEVCVLLTSGAGQLKPGMTATVEIVTASKKDVFAVPIDAVVTKADGTKAVYAYEPGGAIIAAGNPNENAGGSLPAGGRSVDGGAIQDRGAATDRSFSGNLSAGDGNRREIVVKTGMETDYYIEIISDELSEGMMILSDPLGRNVSFSGNGPMMMGAAPVRGGASRAEETVTVVSY